MLRTYRFLALVAALAAGSACTTTKTEAPPPSGPSELGTSVSLSANPDTISQDGSSQSVITVTARDANSQPLGNLPLRAEITVNGVVTDFGRLSSKNLTTGGDGRASFTYTAPKRMDNVDRDTRVTIRVTPQSGDARGDVARQVDIKLVPPGYVGGGLANVPDFKVSPSAPKQLETVIFDAHDPQLDGQLVDYSWDFGDGSVGSGRSSTHEYRDAGTFSATLTVTDTGGSKGSRSKSVNVVTAGEPKADFVFSPTKPVPGQAIIFDASASTAVSPRTIVNYVWQFGPKGSGSGMIVGGVKFDEGEYSVTLTVTDDAGNKNTVSKPVKVEKPVATPDGL